MQSNGNGVGYVTVDGNFMKSGNGDYIIASSSANPSLTVIPGILIFLQVL